MADLWGIETIDDPTMSHKSAIGLQQSSIP
jgi:hypothetical protein